MAIMSQRAYARHRGVAVHAVQKAVRTGRIAALADGQIDSDLADRQWDGNTAPRSPAPALVAGAEDGELPIQHGAGLNATAYLKARAIREQYQARLAKIEYEEKIGKLVNRDEVQVAAYNKYRTFRDQCLNIPDRLAAMLAAETDPAKVHEILSTEIRKALLEFADGSNG